jgi:parallel beta-helix repeat protein
MTRRLSSEALNQLIPLLGSLARLVARGSRVSEDQLRTLLLGVDLESDPAALEELKRWSQLLTALREQPSEDNRLATVEALMLRGLPEAPVLLAVDTVVRNEGSPPPPKRLRASVERLDLGVLSLGQGATAEFEVQGGPGQVVVDSDQVRVTPQQFGAGVTRIRVEVKPLASSGALWTTLKLLTASETLEVPVVAQWIPPTVSIPPGALVVAPDGSGNLRSLEEAVQQARPGAVIYLKAGIHRLKHPLVIDKPLTLIGEGMETTRIVCDGKGCVVEFSGDGLFSARDLAFVHEGTKWGDAVRANKGEVQFYRCLFTGGVWDEVNQRGGSADCGSMGRLVEMSESVWLYGNAGMGIQVSGEAQPTLEGNTCRENKRSGIAYFGSASGTARNNLCTANGLHGISRYTSRPSRPWRATPAGRTSECGIAYFGSASGTARNNLWHSTASWYTLTVRPAPPGRTPAWATSEARHLRGSGRPSPPWRATPAARENKKGLALPGEPTSAARQPAPARQNTCVHRQRNKKHGISVGEQAQPTLESNTCRENKAGTASPTPSAAQAGRLETTSAPPTSAAQAGRLDSTASGYSEQARPTLEGNTCREN